MNKKSGGKIIKQKCPKNSEKNFLKKKTKWQERMVEKLQISMKIKSKKKLIRKKKWQKNN